jgi:hypothetical protein
VRWPVLLLALAVLLTTGCSRIDTLRLAHANGGTPVEWPAGSPSLELRLELDSHGRPWLPVAVDEHAPVPFLLQASAGAIALTGARASGFGPTGAGRLTLREGLLPGIPGGTLVKGRRLALDALVLGDQSLLLVEEAHWPHEGPRPGAAGVMGYDLLRRFVVELDVDGRRLRLYRAGGLDVGTFGEVQRLAVLDRRAYFEAWLERGEAGGEWLRLQFEPGAPGGFCLDRPGRPGTLVIAGVRIAPAAAPCPGIDPAGQRATRDGLLGAAALRGLVVAVDYERRRIGFQPGE